MSNRHQLKPINFEYVGSLMAQGKTKEVYEYLANECDSQYAQLALGIVDEHHQTIAGVAAVDHLKTIAQEYRPHRPLDNTEIRQIMDQMLVPYVELMRTQQQEDQNYEEATYDQAHTFHTVVFARHHLPPQAWTLDPLSTLPKEQYDDLWDLSLVAAGDQDKEMAIGAEILGALAERRNSLDYTVADIAQKPSTDFPQTLQELKTACTERQELFKWRNISLNNAMGHADTYYYGAKYATQHPIQLGTVVVKWANNPFNIDTVEKVCSSTLKGEMDAFAEGVQHEKNNTPPKQPKIDPTDPILQNNPYFNNPLDPYQQQQKINETLYP
ncbi:MAG: hypothetical protein N4Q30_01790, partial [Neisseriaceae bacterium]|nr:hypothetical protein [Neisseriaceae bacterium]